MPDDTIQQLKKAIEDVELSDLARQKLNEVLARVEEKGTIEEQDKNYLLEIIRGDMVLDEMEASALTKVQKDLDKATLELTSRS